MCFQANFFRLFLSTTSAEASLSAGDASKNGIIKNADPSQEKLRKALTLKRADAISYNSPSSTRTKLKPRKENAVEDELSSCFSNLVIRSPTSPTFNDNPPNSFRSPLPVDRCGLNKLTFYNFLV